MSAPALRDGRPPARRHAGPPRVAVIGAGYAGCAAAVALAQRGFATTLFEAAPTLGGRARRVLRDGLALDNGQHLVLGAYRETLALRETVGAPRAPTHALMMTGLPGDEDVLRMRARDWPAPFGLLAGMATARGLGLGERLAMLRWFATLRRRGFACDPRASVAGLTATLPPRAAARLWHPLCLAALNTHPHDASAQVFANVLGAALDGARHDPDMIGIASDLSAWLPEPCAQWLLARGHAVRTRSRAVVADAGDEGIRLRHDGASDDTGEHFDAAVVAVGPHQLAAALQGPWLERVPHAGEAIARVGAFAYEPITTVYLGYPAAPADLRIPPGLVRLDDAPGQWLFTRDDILARAAQGLDEAGGAADGVMTGAAPLATPGAGLAALPGVRALLAVVISAHGPHDELAHDALAHAVAAQLARLAPGWPAPSWHFVIEEKRATYRATPSLLRPAAGLVAPCLALAGDYTDDRYPATLEAAVRSGNRAAAALAGLLS